MDIRQLRYFLAIAQEKQVTRAAKTLNMEQPPLSRQIKLMEEEIGVKLFERNGRQMELTQAGQILELKAKSLLNQLNEIVTEIKEIDGGLKGILSIGSVFSCVSLLPPKIKKFHEMYPQVIFKILEGDHFVMARYFEDKAIEIALTRLPFEANYGLDRYIVKPLPSDPFVLLMPSNWAENISSEAILIKEIRDLPLIAFKSDRTIRLNEKLINECRRVGFEPNIICECGSVSIIISLVMSGIGAAILPKSVMSSFPISQIKMFDISDLHFRSEVGVVWLNNRYLSKSASRFIDIITHNN